MVIDTSALIAILLGEPEAKLFARLIAADASERLVSSFSALEAAIVIQARKGDAGVRELDLLFQSAKLTILSLDAEQVLLARNAYREFGKGRHPAKLNLGDCCSYALARASKKSLLFKGEDFSKTDIPAIWRPTEEDEAEDSEV